MLSMSNLPELMMSIPSKALPGILAKRAITSKNLSKTCIMTGAIRAGKELSPTTCIVVGAIAICTLCFFMCNPPRQVAQIFRSVTKEWDGVFPEVIFAILGGDFNIFQDVFCQSQD